MRRLFARQILAAIAGILAWAAACPVAMPQDYPTRARLIIRARPPRRRRLAKLADEVTRIIGAPDFRQRTLVGRSSSRAARGSRSIGASSALSARWRRRS
jgi:hypothetical protein